MKRPVLAAAILGWAVFGGDGAARAAAPAGTSSGKPARIATRTKTLNQLKGWTLPEAKFIKFNGTLPVKKRDGTPLKARFDAEAIYYVDILSGQRIYKPGSTWGVDTLYPDHRAGRYTYRVAKRGNALGVRSFTSQCGTFAGQPFALLDVNSNGRFDDAGVDVFVFDKTAAVKVGEPVVIGKERYEAKVSASGQQVIFGKALAFASANLAGGDSGVAGALATWNAIRASLQVPPVRRDPKLESWGYKHIAYMKAIGHLSHPENKSHPKYTPEGHKAGMGSDLSWGRTTAKDALLGLMDTFFHRIALIRPQLEVTGIAFDPASRFGVFDWANGPRRKKVKWPGPIAYPPDGASGVRPGWSGHEGPSPIPVAPPPGGIGQTVTLTFPPKQKPKSATLVLSETGGAAVEGWVSTPEKPAAGMFRRNMNSLCFIAKKPLKPNTRYNVKATATLNGRPFEKTWRFTTGQAARRWGGRRGGKRKR